jgi:diacylglycerol kinase (ATP)
MIDVGKIKYAKKLAIIYNPEAGKKNSIKDKISKRLVENNIEFEFIETKAYMDAVNIVKNLPIDDYSAIVSVGGDGTSHEVINGLFYREDNKKIPLAFLPNGTGNDFCINLSLESIDKGLDYIVKGDLIKTDIFRVLLDYESEEELYEK